MELQFWGAARTVTGSMHLLKVNNHQLLLDCGLYQGRRKEAYEINRRLPFDAAEIDALILSHAHTDHSGNIPSLVKNGFRGTIWCTSATRDLAAAMLRDSAHIQESDVKYVNKRRRRQGKRLFEPLYTQDDALAAMEQFQSVEYGRPFSPLPGVEVHFRDAGHILGSAVTVLDIDDAGRDKRLVFSGDIGRKNLPILRDPQPVQEADVVIMESTYGLRYHASSGEAREALRQVVSDTHQRRGKVIIPAFAVGRTQELVYALHQLTEDNRIPSLDIFVDSPLAVNITEIFRLHPECYDDEMQDFMLQDEHDDPFGFGRLRYVRDVNVSKQLNDLEEPAIIISASGMCEAGRILHHLKNNIEDRRNTILFVGYQAEHTLGRKILDGRDIVPILGGDYRVRADVVRVEGYSAHADRNGLLNWLESGRQQGDPQRVFLVHGEEKSSLALADALRERGLPRVDVPERGQAFEV
ncbi:MAG: MBL fold metallo-hydrolase RNA specificity domain-containing protein [Anaerolineae bacterium]